MSRSAFTKFLLPAILVFSAVFAALNLSFPTQKANPLLTQILLFGNREIKPTSMGTQGLLMVRYVGFSLIISVGAGVATVETVRRYSRWKRKVQSRRLLQDSLSHLAVSSQEEEDACNDISISESELNLLFQNGNFDIETDGAELSDIEDFSHSQMFTDQMELPQTYEICRIRVPHRRQRLMAISIDGDYYRFVKSEVDRAQAFNLVVEHIQKGEQAVITSMRNGYAVWVREPEAYADLAG